MKKTLAKIILGITIFLGAIICCQNVSKASNLDLFRGQYDEIQRVGAVTSNDITEEIRRISREALNENKKVLIHIPSGTFVINNTAIFSNIGIVAENDTVLVSNESAERMIRIADATNVMIYGGTWNANSKSQNGIETNNVKNLKIENVSVQNATKYGMVLYKGTTANIKNVKVKDNNNYGIYCQESIATIENSEITNNDCTGIACAKTNAKVYIKNNKVNNNGQNPRKTEEGYLGHGVGIQDGAYGEINNNIINNNKVCGISVSSSNECGTSKVNISNNKIYNNGRHGIGARKKTEMTVVGNEIYSNSYDGIIS